MKKTFTLMIAALFSTVMLFGQTPHALVKSDVGGETVWTMDSKADFIWLCDSANLDADNDATDDFASRAEKFGGNYVLAADITFDPDPSKEDWNNDGAIDDKDARGLSTIGYWSLNASMNVDHFSGTFDGGYHIIENVWKKDQSRGSLFGNLVEASIENIYLKNYYSESTGSYVCGIAARDDSTGTAGSTIKRCWVEGTLKPIREVGDKSVYSGGIIGRLNLGEISECVTNVTIETNLAAESRRAGGLVGQIEIKSDATQDASIINSYSVSTISATDDAGGILGRFQINSSASNSASATYCYSASNVTDGVADVGAFTGEMDAADVSNSYWDSDIMATGIAKGDETAMAMATGLPTASFADAGNFPGWDFTTIWKIGDVYGTQRPMLQWQEMVGGGPSSVKDVKRSSLIQTYPNPVSEMLTILNAPINSKYQLVNMVGQTVKSGIVTNRRTLLNVQSFEKGVYLLKIGDNVNKIMIK